MPEKFAQIHPRPQYSCLLGACSFEHIRSGGVKRPQEAYELGVDENGERGRKKEGSRSVIVVGLGA